MRKPFLFFNIALCTDILLLCTSLPPALFNDDDDENDDDDDDADDDSDNDEKKKRPLLGKFTVQTSHWATRRTKTRVAATVT